MIRFKRERFIPKNATTYEGANCVVYSYEHNGKNCAVAYRGKSSRPAWHYSFMSETTRQTRITEFLESSLDHEKARIELKQAKEKAIASFQNPYKVGDIFYNSWGYDQTNIDFYQVVDVKKKSVVLRPIAAETTYEEGYAAMSGLVTPIKDAFRGDAITKHIRVSVYTPGKVNIYIPAKHGSMNLWDGQKKYCSWYA